MYAEWTLPKEQTKTSERLNWSSRECIHGSTKGPPSRLLLF